MGSRKKNDRLQNETNFEGAFKVHDQTPEEAALAAWKPDQVLLNAGQKASYGAARQGVIEGAGGYSGIANPFAAARMKQIGLQELADRESSAMADANLDMNQLDLQNKQFLAGLRKPEWIQTKQWGYGEQPKQSSGLLDSIIGGGATVVAAF